MKVIEDYLQSYLDQFEDASVTLGDNNVLVFNLINGYSKYIQLQGFIRLYKDGVMLFESCSPLSVDYVKQIEGLSIGTVESISIDESHNLHINILDNIKISIVSCSEQYENWVINEEVVCLPGGEITDFLDKPKKELSLKPLSTRAKKIAADISEKYSFCYYCAFKLHNGSSGDKDYINSYFYKLYWASTLAVVLEGVNRLVKYEEFNSECISVLEYSGKPFNKVNSKDSKEKLLKDFRDHMFHSQEKYRNDKRRIVLENDFPYSELEKLTFLIRDKLVKKIRSEEYHPYNGKLDPITKEMLERVGLPIDF